jgi:hypothetical protein
MGKEDGVACPQAAGQVQVAESGVLGLAVVSVNPAIGAFLLSTDNWAIDAIHM